MRAARKMRYEAMELEKIRNLGADELKHEEQQASEQLFRLRFQMRLGQTEGVKKLRGLKKDIARMKTIAREHALGLNTAVHHADAPAKKTAAKKVAKKKVAKKPVAKKAAGKKATGKKVLGKKAAPKKAAAKKKTTKTKEAR